MKKMIKKFTINFLCILSLLLTTGCLKKKKNIEEKSSVVSNNILDKKDSIESFEEDNENIKGESIFADDGEIYEENETIEEPNKIIENIEKVYDYNEASYKKRLLKEPIIFGFNISDNFREDQVTNFESIINEIKELLIQNKNLKLLIIGHACNSEGTEKYNLQLSDKRAKTIENILLKIFPELIGATSSFGKGISELIIKHGNKKQQAINRRVEVFVIN